MCTRKRTFILLLFSDLIWHLGQLLQCGEFMGLGSVSERDERPVCCLYTLGKRDDLIIDACDHQRIRNRG